MPADQPGHQSMVPDWKRLRRLLKQYVVLSSSSLIGRPIVAQWLPLSYVVAIKPWSSCAPVAAEE